LKEHKNNCNKYGCRTTFFRFIKSLLQDQGVIVQSNTYNAHI